MRYFNN